MNILVTGACGFIGSHLVEKLVKENHNVRAFTFYNSRNSHGWLDNVDKKILKDLDLISGDIRDYDFLYQQTKKIDVIIHLAALIGIPYSYHAVKSYIDTNVTGTYNVLNSAKINNVSKTTITSTSEVYGTAQKVPILENHPLSAQSPYAASKIAADQLALSFYKSYGLSLTIMRPFNTFGPRQSARAIIPTIITQLLSRKEEINLGDLSPTRDFCYIQDTVNGFIEIEKSENTIGEEINISSQQEISIHDLSSKIINLINPNAKIIYDENRKRPNNSEVDRLLGSNKKLKELTQWKQQYDLISGLKETIEWFKQKANIKQYKSDIYNV